DQHECAGSDHDTIAWTICFAVAVALGSLAPKAGSAGILPAGTAEADRDVCAPSKSRGTACRALLAMASVILVSKLLVGRARHAVPLHERGHEACRVPNRKL